LTGSAIELTEHNRKSPHSPRSFARTLALFVSTVAGVGYAPVAPGTFGSAAAIPIFVLLSRLDPLLYSLTVVALVFLGIWAADMTEAIFGRKDDGRIVIDEVVGQLIALAPLVILGASRKSALIVTGFVAFRLFDVWKPGPVGKAERGFRGGAGVVLDDVVAGLLAAAVVAALALGSGL
jgi:phosphatidylglycerophosphatase A